MPKITLYIKTPYQTELFGNGVIKQKAKIRVHPRLKKSDEKYDRFKRHETDSD